MLFGALSPGHCRSQVEPPPQSTEQLPVHVMWQVAPPEQSTLALGPTVIVHDEVPVHLRLHELPHSPMQSFMFEQSSEQLFSQTPEPMSHADPAGQVQVEPLHLGGAAVLLLPPHAAANARARTKSEEGRLGIRPSSPELRAVGRSADHLSDPCTARRSSTTAVPSNRPARRSSSARGSSSRR